MATNNAEESPDVLSRGITGANEGTQAKMTPVNGKRKVKLKITRFFAHGGFSDVFLGSIEGKNYDSTSPVVVKIVTLDSKPRLVKKINLIRKKRRGFLSDDYEKVQAMNLPRTMKYDTVLNELNVLKKLKSSPFVVDLIGEVQKLWEVWLVTEYCPYPLNAFFSKLNNKMRTVCDAFAVHMLSPILSALLHLKSMNLIHRDVKPGNILVNSKGIPKIIDFGAVIEVEKGFDCVQPTIRAGSMYHIPPESVRGELICWKTDAFGFALTFFQTFFTTEGADELFGEIEWPDIVKAYEEQSGETWEEVKKELKAQCLEPDYGMLKKLPVWNGVKEDLFKMLNLSRLKRSGCDSLASNSHFKSALRDWDLFSKGKMNKLSDNFKLQRGIVAFLLSESDPKLSMFRKYFENWSGK